ncbi:MAG: nuclear transport factor 2 family protein [Pseudomonadota bacterium]|nr:nuclear transport factor 2 family protein [Pseudomonadota bacterium]
MKTSKPIFTTPAAVEEAFYDALSRGDVQGVMSLWAEDDDIVCIQPGGPRTTGMSAVRQAWEGVLAGRLDIRARSIQRYETMTTAVSSVIEEITVAGDESVRCVATNVFVKDARGWRIILHHASPAGDADESAPASTGAVLH